MLRITTKQQRQPIGSIKKVITDYKHCVCWLALPRLSREASGRACPDSDRDFFCFFSLYQSLSRFIGNKEKKENKSNYIYALSFACAKESAKEKHTGNDLQPLPSR